MSEVPLLSAELYRVVVGLALATPHPVHVFAEIATEGVIVLFGLLFGVSLWRGWRRSPLDRAQVLLAPGAVVVAYLISEGIKAVWRQDRPCRALTVVAECPELGDWSFPSNHSTIAGAAALALWWCQRDWGWFLLPAALGAAASRVFVGVHYPHDVLAGLTLGAVVASVLLPMVRFLPLAKARR